MWIFSIDIFLISLWWSLIVSIFPENSILFFYVESNATACAFHIFFIYPSADEHLGWSWVSYCE